MNNAIALRLRSVGVYYRRRNRLFRTDCYWALKNVSFDLYHGETLGVIGRNGVGKSTLLRLLADIIKPDKGEIIRYSGRASLLTLQLGFVSHLTGRENAILSGILMGETRRNIREKMEFIIELSGLERFIDHPVGTYSSGMRARLGFAVATCAAPDILLVDEVLGVGDAEFKDKSGRIMKERIRSDQTAVVVSHNPNTIRELCDRVIWLEGGELKVEGETDHVLKLYYDARRT